MEITSNNICTQWSQQPTLSQWYDIAENLLFAIAKQIIWIAKTCFGGKQLFCKLQSLLKQVLKREKTCLGSQT